jgi:hypothetical protein
MIWTQLVAFCALLALVAAGSDSVPLKATEATALRALYTALNCNNRTACPLVANNTACPTMPKLAWSEALLCLEGTVREIGIYHVVRLRNASFPSSMSGFSQLSLLYVFGHGSELQGTFPSALLRLPSLKLIDIADNDISGTIPSELALSTVITHISVHFNQFSGTIPTQLASMSQLQFVRFYKNQFRGVAPKFASNITCSLTLSNDTNCFSTCLLPSCCRSPVFCPDPTTTTTTTATSAQTKTMLGLTTATFSTTTTLTESPKTTTTEVATTEATTESTTTSDTSVESVSSRTVTEPSTVDSESSVTTADSATTTTEQLTSASVGADTSANVGDVGDPSDSASTNIALIAGVAGIGGCVLLLALIGIVVAVARRRRQQQAATVPPAANIRDSNSARVPPNNYQPLPAASAIMDSAQSQSSASSAYGDVPKRDMYMNGNLAL